MNMWTIYFSPKDAPGRYVVRRWHIGVGVATAHEAHISETLEGVRGVVPPGMYRLERHADDDPVIVEVWL